jgi:DhnA family fructose-bisphosphate aldolase class Ia
MSTSGWPRLILAADHRARGVVTTENYSSLLSSLRGALAHCDGLLATIQPLFDLARSGAVEPHHRTYLSLNRTGLAGSAFELDDRLVTSVGRAKEAGLTGIKHMTRIDFADPLSAPALELLGQVLEASHQLGLEALIEPLIWRDGAMARDTDSIVLAAMIAHDMGAPLLKVPVPDVAGGRARVDAVARVVASVGVPVLFLGGPKRDEPADALLDEVRDVMAGGASGLAIGRAIYQDAAPDELAKRIADIVHDR